MSRPRFILFAVIWLLAGVFFRDAMNVEPGSQRAVEFAFGWAALGAFFLLLADWIAEEASRD